MHPSELLTFPSGPDSPAVRPTPHPETTEETAVAETNLPPLTRRDLTFANCPTPSLTRLSFLYFEDKESLLLIAQELERRGIDPFD